MVDNFWQPAPSPPLTAFFVSRQVEASRAPPECPRPLERGRGREEGQNLLLYTHAVSVPCSSFSAPGYYHKGGSTRGNALWALKDKQGTVAGTQGGEDN